MTDNSVETYARSEPGRRFFDAYDAATARWPGVECLDVTSRYGITRVNTCGDPENPPVLLLPGGGASSLSWSAIAPTLARAHRVIAPDLIGDVGRSRPSSTPPTSIEDISDWISATLSSLHVENVALVGHSYGAMLGVAHALRQPETIRSLTLVDPNSVFTRMSARYLLHALPILLQPNEIRYRRFLDWETDNSTVDAAWLEMAASGAATFPTARPIVPKRPSRQQLRSLAMPVTVILAPDSKVHNAGRVSETATAALPEAHVTVLPHGTHHTLPMWPADDIATAILGAV